MALSPSLDMHQAQSLTMTPQLMQSIKLLQMAALELEQYLNDVLEKNPLLERVDAANSIDNVEPSVDSPEENNEHLNLASDDSAEKLIPEFSSAEALQNIFDSEEPSNHSHENQAELTYNSDRSTDWNEISLKPLPLEMTNIAETVADKPSLQSFIAEQIALAFASQKERDIARYLADQLNEAGYFVGSLSDTSEKFAIDIKEIDSIFARLQQFDPAGVFCRSLKECLALQLERVNRLDPAIAAVLDNLPALAKRDFAYLSKISNLDQSELLDILQEIRRLDPKPGLAFSQDPLGFVVPDVIIRASGNGEFLVELNQAILPRLIIHRDYALKIGRDTAERHFISECLQNANWLLRALDQRATTLLKVTAEIVRFQQDFLRYGVGFLKPLTLATVAEAVGMHESTISRVTANKYVATPRGTFEMRSFFSASLQSTSGEESHAADAVRHRIRELVDNEDADHILSDDTLVQLLRKENIDIARRTVAKYRELMNIPSSVARRREKKAKQNTTSS